MENLELYIYIYAIQNRDRLPKEDLSDSRFSFHRSKVTSMKLEVLLLLLE